MKTFIADCPNISIRVIHSLLKRAKQSGFKADWDCASELENGDILFGRSTWKDYDDEISIIAGKRNGKWIFFTDTYQQLTEKH